MKLGVLILCHNVEQQIQTEHIIRQFAHLDGVDICLVNNHSTDSTFDKLLDIQEYCESISLININKHKSEQAALRAGSRFMFNRSRATCLGYLPGLEGRQLNELIRGLDLNREAILVHLQQLKSKHFNRVTKCQELFEIPMQLLTGHSNKQPA